MQFNYLYSLFSTVSPPSNQYHLLCFCYHVIVLIKKKAYFAPFLPPESVHTGHCYACVHVFGAKNVTQQRRVSLSDCTKRCPHDRRTAPERSGINLAANAIRRRQCTRCVHFDLRHMRHSFFGAKKTNCAMSLSTHDKGPYCGRNK